jgi:hypothetical protein
LESFLETAHLKDLYTDGKIILKLISGNTVKGCGLDSFGSRYGAYLGVPNRPKQFREITDIPINTRLNINVLPITVTRD